MLYSQRLFQLPYTLNYGYQQSLYDTPECSLLHKIPQWNTYILAVHPIITVYTVMMYGLTDHQTYTTNCSCYWARC